MKTKLADLGIQGQSNPNDGTHSEEWSFELDGSIAAKKNVADIDDAGRDATGAPPAPTFDVQLWNALVAKPDGMDIHTIPGGKLQLEPLSDSTTVPDSARDTDIDTTLHATGPNTDTIFQEDTLIFLENKLNR